MSGTKVKTKLYETAVDLMGHQGIAATGTREVITAAGIHNPSAISYYFGSKAELVDAIATEAQDNIVGMLQQQTQLATDTTTPTVTEWVTPVLDAAITLLSSKRGCLLARVWWEFDGYLEPESLEAFLNGPNRIATAWRAAIVTVFPQFPAQIGLARNVAMIRTVAWMAARMATINLDNHPFIVGQHPRFRRWLEEIAVTMLSAPTTLTNEDVAGSDIR